MILFKACEAKNWTSKLPHPILPCFYIHRTNLAIEKSMAHAMGSVYFGHERKAGSSGLMFNRNPDWLSIFLYINFQGYHVLICSICFYKFLLKSIDNWACTVQIQPMFRFMVNPLRFTPFECKRYLGGEHRTTDGDVTAGTFQPVLSVSNAVATYSDSPWLSQWTVKITTLVGEW
jgi:hypothetical protein